MSVLRPRNRLVNFRLSEDEFERLKASCALQGARSVSDFARSAVLDRMETGTPTPHAAPAPRQFQMDNRISDLETQVGQLLHLISATGLSQSLMMENAKAAAMMEVRKA